MLSLFSNGGTMQMLSLTLVLLCMLFAAWKARKWVKELGLLALLLGILYQAVGLFHALGIIQQAGDISTGLLCGGLQLSLITVIYGMMIYGVSLLIRLFQKPKN